MLSHEEHATQIGIEDGVPVFPLYVQRGFRILHPALFKRISIGPFAVAVSTAA